MNHMKNVLVLLSMASVVTKLAKLPPEDELHVLALAVIVSERVGRSVEVILDTWASSPGICSGLSHPVRLQKEEFAKRGAGALAAVGIEA